MKLEQKHINHIKSAFATMQTKEDFLLLLNEVKPLIYGEKTVPFKLKQLSWYANPKVSGERYKEFKIKKKSGSERSIHAPVKGLKALQKTIAVILQSIYEPNKATMGFVTDRSIVDNANVHVGNRFIYNIDLKDFFPSVDQARVWKCLQLKPFKLVDELNIVPLKPNMKKPVVKSAELFSRYQQTVIVKFEDGTNALISLKQGFKSEGDTFTSIFCDDDSNELLDGWNIVAVGKNKWIIKEDSKIGSISTDFSRIGIANIIASLCCTEMLVERKNKSDEWELVKRNVLPQGAPTSPVITNIVCQRLDYLLSSVAKRFGLKYSRYADDITFSSLHNVYQVNSDFIKELHRIIAEQNFHIKETKTRLQKDGYCKEVTGLLVNERVNVRKRYIKELRMWLYYWERYGYERTYEYFLKQYISDKSNVKNSKPDMANVISGKLDYLKMVKGETNSQYKKLAQKFNTLSFENPIIFSKDKIAIKNYKNALISKDKKFKKELIYRENEIKQKLAIKAKDEFFSVIHDPKKTIWLLNKFTEDTYLKYTTHIWDRNKDTSKETVDRNYFHDEIKKELSSKFNFQQLLEIGLKQLYWTITDFIVGPNHFGWGKYKLKFGWYNDQLKSFYLENRDKQPGSFLVPEEFIPNTKIEGRYLKYFDDFIDCFKNEIQFRGNNLYLTLKTEFEKQLGFEYKIEYEGLKGIDIYTDTRQISEAFQLIASNIRQHPDKSKILKVKGIHRKAEMLYEIRIEDIGSFANSPIESDKLKLKDKKGQIYKIRDLLISLCDFSIESKFRVDGDFYKGYELSYLSKDRRTLTNDIPYIRNDVENPIGFTYILKFYE